MNSSQHAAKHAEFSRFLEVLERRLETLRFLADELRQSTDAVVNLDLLRLDRVTDRQRTLCKELAALNGELAEWEGKLPQGVTPAGAEVVAHYQELQQEMSGLQGEIARLSRVHQALLRRARRSTQVMANVLAFCFPLYAPAAEWPARK